MVKKLLSFATLLLFLGAGSSLAQVSIGYMDTQKVMNESLEIQQVQKELEAFIQEKQQELANKTSQYQQEIAEYQQRRESMSQQQIEQREQELTTMTTDLKEFDQRIRSQIQQKRQDLLMPVLQSMNDAIAAVAKAQNLDFVINKSTNVGENILFYASANQENITQEVLNRLNSSSQQK